MELAEYRDNRTQLAGVYPSISFVANPQKRVNPEVNELRNRQSIDECRAQVSLMPNVDCL